MLPTVMKKLTRKAQIQMEFDEKSATLKDMLKLIVGEVIIDAVVVLIFALLDKLNYTVFLGLLLGTAVNTLCFFILCISVNKMITDGDQAHAKRTIGISYAMRLLILALSLAVGFKFDCFNPIAVIVPVLSTRPILSVYSLFEKGRNKNDRS